MRRTVEHLQGCLGTLPVDERRVLLLRANLMGAVPRSRGSVAARLRIPPDRVAGLEQRGLAHLELVSAISGCANQAGSAMAFGGVSAIDFRGAGPTSGPFAPSLRSQPTPPRSQEPAQEVAGATAHGASVAATAFIPARAFPFPAALAGVAALVLSAALVFFLLGPPRRRRLSGVGTGMAPNDDARRVAETTRPPDGHAPDDVSGGAPENPTRADEPPGESGGRSPEPAVEPAMPSGNVPFPADAPPEPDRGREPVTTEHRARSHRVRSGLGMAVGAMVMAGLRRWRRRTR